MILQCPAAITWRCIPLGEGHRRTSCNSSATTAELLCRDCGDGGVCPSCVGMSYAQYTWVGIDIQQQMLELHAPHGLTGCCAGARVAATPSTKPTIHMPTNHSRHTILLLTCPVHLPIDQGTSPLLQCKLRYQQTQPFLHCIRIPLQAGQEPKLLDSSHH